MFYNLFIYIIAALSPLLSLGGGKVAQWYAGRRGLIKRVKREFKDNKSPIIWFHCASLGEFEQGREVIQEARKRYIGYKIVVTFFSPSGYNQQKNYQGADYVCYLPIDTPNATRAFVKALNPQIVVFVKYDFWPNIIKAIKRSGAKLYVISAIFNPKQHFFKWYGRGGVKALKQFDCLFVQNRESLRLLGSVGIYDAVLSGDTRFDRVYTLGQQQISVGIVEQFLEGNSSLVLVAGSTWAPDEKLLVELSKDIPDIKLIVAPHQINENSIDTLANAFSANGKVVSRYTKGIEPSSDVLIVDTIGVLSKLYRYGDFAYIGGGFGVGIHNTLEAATYGMPIAFGPNYLRFAEAVDMVTIGCAKSIDNAEGLIRWVNTLLRNTILRRKFSDSSRRYVEDKRGSTEIIISYIAKVNNIAYDTDCEL